MSQIFGTQKISDDDVLRYFQQTEEKIHSMDTRKLLKFPERAPASKANAINTGDGQAKAKGKGTQRSLSIPPANSSGQQKGFSRRRKRGQGRPRMRNLNRNKEPHQSRLQLPLQNPLRHDSEEEPEPEAEAVPIRTPITNQRRPPGNHSHPQTVIGLQELAQRFTDEAFDDPVCQHMRGRSMFADIIFGANQHSRWLYCRQCSASGAVQTLDMMSCVNCSLRHIHHPEVDTRKTCVWIKWLRMIARYRFRMTDEEKSQLKRQIQQRQDKRRFRRLALQPSPEESLQTIATELDDGPATLGIRREDLWEEAIRQERLSLLSHHATMELSTGSEAASSGTTQPSTEGRFIHVEHAAFASRNVITTRR